MPRAPVRHFLPLLCKGTVICFLDIPLLFSLTVLLPEELLASPSPLRHWSYPSPSQPIWTANTSLALGPICWGESNAEPWNMRSASGWQLWAEGRRPGLSLPSTRAGCPALTIAQEEKVLPARSHQPRAAQLPWATGGHGEGQCELMEHTPSSVKELSTLI